MHYDPYLYPFFFFWYSSCIELIYRSSMSSHVTLSKESLQMHCDPYLYLYEGGLSKLNAEGVLKFDPQKWAPVISSSPIIVMDDIANKVCNMTILSLKFTCLKRAVNYYILPICRKQRYNPCTSLDFTGSTPCPQPKFKI